MERWVCGLNSLAPSGRFHGAVYPGLKAWAILCYRFAVGFHLSLVTFHLSLLTSSNRWHIELVSPGILVPALHNALVPRVKAHPFFAISVVAAKQRTFPTAK
jgi:hypothetical protein